MLTWDENLCVGCSNLVKERKVVVLDKHGLPGVGFDLVQTFYGLKLNYRNGRLYLCRVCSRLIQRAVYHKKLYETLRDKQLARKHAFHDNPLLDSMKVEETTEDETVPPPGRSQGDEGVDLKNSDDSSFPRGDKKSLTVRSGILARKGPLKSDPRRKSATGQTVLAGTLAKQKDNKTIADLKGAEALVASCCHPLVMEPLDVSLNCTSSSNMNSIQQVILPGPPTEAVTGMEPDNQSVMINGKLYKSLPGFLSSIVSGNPKVGPSVSISSTPVTTKPLLMKSPATTSGFPSVSISSTPVTTKPLLVKSPATTSGLPSVDQSEQPLLVEVPMQTDNTSIAANSDTLISYKSGSKQPDAMNRADNSKLSVQMSAFPDSEPCLQYCNKTRVVPVDLFAKDRSRKLIKICRDPAVSHSTDANKKPSLSKMPESVEKPFVKTDRRVYTSVRSHARRQTICYRTLPLAKQMSPVVKNLCNGAVRKAVKSLARATDKSTRIDFYRGVCGIIYDECQKLILYPNSRSLRTNDPRYLAKVKVNDIVTEIKKSAPTLWQILNAAATRKRFTEAPLFRVLMACSILLRTNSYKLSAIQYLNSIALYDLVKKEGLQHLDRLGITVSYNCLQRKLQEAEMQLEDDATWPLNQTGDEPPCQADHQDYDHAEQDVTWDMKADHPYCAEYKSIPDPPIKRVKRKSRTLTNIQVRETTEKTVFLAADQKLTGCNKPVTELPVAVTSDQQAATNENNNRDILLETAASKDEQSNNSTTLLRIMHVDIETIHSETNQSKVSSERNHQVAPESRDEAPMDFDIEDIS